MIYRAHVQGIVEQAKPLTQIDKSIEGIHVAVDPVRAITKINRLVDVVAA